MKRILVCAAAVLVCASPALAQTRPRPASARSQKPPQDRPGLRMFGAVDAINQSASQTFKAIFGTDTLRAYGAGVDVVNIFKHVFVRVAVTKTSIDGERVDVTNGQTTKLGIPLQLSMTPVEIAAGWRFTSKNPKQLVTPYLGAGAVMLNYKETSNFGDSSDNTSKSFNGYGMFAGADVRITRLIAAGGEFHYRSIGNALGQAGASKEFNENDLGGTVLRFHVAFRY